MGVLEQFNADLRRIILCYLILILALHLYLTARFGVYYKVVTAFGQDIKNLTITLILGIGILLTLTYLKYLEDSKYRVKITEKGVYSLKFPLRFAVLLQRVEIREYFFVEIKERVLNDCKEYGLFWAKFYLWQDSLRNICYLIKIKIREILWEN